MDFLQIFTLVTGAVYIVLQILQNRWMWPLCIVTSSGALAVACISHYWAYAFLNVYFIVMAVVGILKWKRLENKTGDKTIHLVHKDIGIALVSKILFVALALLSCQVLSLTNDPNPVPDGIAFAISMIAAWWLARSYPGQWILWIAANIIYVWMYLGDRMWGMAILYAVYTVSAVIGYIHWKRRGVYVDD